MDKIKKILINYLWILIDAIVAAGFTATADYLYSIENEVQWSAIITLLFIPISKELNKAYKNWRTSKK